MEGERKVIFIQLLELLSSPEGLTAAAAHFRPSGSVLEESHHPSNLPAGELSLCSDPADTELVGED